MTPTNYLEPVAGYRELLNLKRKELSDAAGKRRNGLSKIDETRSKGEAMSVRGKGEAMSVKVKVAQGQGG